MSNSLGFALGAGGARGIAHIGFLKALEENEIKPDFLAGASMGALVGACYSKGMSLNELKDIFFSLKPLEILDIDLSAIKKSGLIRCAKLKKLFCKYLGGVNMEELAIPYKCVATDVISGTEVVLEKGDLADRVLASCSMPFIFRPVKIDDKMLVDGGVVNRVPADVVKKMGADKVIAVDVLGEIQPVSEVKQIFSFATRVFDIVDWNNTKRAKKDRKMIIDLWLEPDMKGLSQYRFKDIFAAYDAGYACGMANLEKIKKLRNAK